MWLFYGVTRCIYLHVFCLNILNFTYNFYVDPL